MTSTSLAEYLSDLEDALDLRSVPQVLIVDIVRQVQSHTEESGDSPYESFGSPTDYARRMVPESSMAAFWILIASTVVLTLGGGWLLVHGVISLIGGRTILWGIHPLFGIVVGGAAIIVWMAILIVRARKR
ncbi:MAG: hypothetical protein JWQ43_3739 [Glaciihabitans sp.]|nr:hypothetical protein [Glaciihabitans sp.]